MLWLRKKGAAYSETFQNAQDAVILWFTHEPPNPQQVDATVVRQGVVSQISTSDEESFDLARAAAEKVPPWVPVVSEGKWEKFVNLDHVTDVVLQDDPAPGSMKRVRKLVLSVTYRAPDNPHQPQTYVCGEVHERTMIKHVLERFGHAVDEEEEELVVYVEPSPAPRAKKKARAS